MAKVKYGRGTVRPPPMPAEHLRQFLSYDRETGHLTWKDCPAGGQGAKRVKPGTLAGCVSTLGYVVIRLNKVLYPAHRLAWYLETGEWPCDQIDHINEKKSDNRWCNLREATHAENTHYRHQARIARQPPKPVLPTVPLLTYGDGPVTIEELKRLLTYDAETGFLRWKEDRGCNFNRRKAGSVAGGRSRQGYIVIKIDGVFYKAHRLAWVMMTGEWPKTDIDHINGIKWDNCWSNLRLATRSQNQHWVRKRQTGKTGYRGVTPNGNGFRAQISIGGKLIYFPTRTTAAEAYADYCAAAHEHHGAFARYS